MIKILISVIGDDKKQNKRIINLIDNTLFTKGESAPEGVEIEYKNIRTRVRGAKAVSTDKVTEEADSQEDQ